MGKKLRQKLTSFQQRLLRNMIVILLVILLGWLLFAPDMGVWSLHRKRSQIEDLRTQKEKLERENQTLRDEIDRLENDMDYFERLAREKYGLLKEDEIVIDFGEDKQ